MSSPDERTRRLLQLLLANLGVALLYVAVGVLSFVFETPPNNIRVIVPVGGFALAAVAVWGWPVVFGVFAGSFIHNCTWLRGPPLDVAAVGSAIAFAAALQAWLGAYLLRRFVGVIPPPGVRLILRAMALLALTSLVAPAGRVTVLGASGYLPWSQAPTMIWTGWLGMYAGILLVAPGLIVIARRRGRGPVEESLAWPIACGLVGLALVSFSLGWQQGEQRLNAQLRDDAAEMTTVIEAEAADVEKSVIAARAFFEASRTVEPGAFRAFARPILESKPKTLGMGWAPRVSAAGREDYERTIGRAMGLPDFRIFELDAGGRPVPAADRDEYFPPTCVEPLDHNGPAIGFDLFSEGTRHQAIVAARDSGKPVLAAPIRLVQAASSGESFLLLVPIYRTGAPADSVESRRQNLSGVAFGAFLLRDVVESGLGQLTAHDIELLLFDVSDPRPRFLAFRPSSSGPQTVPEGKIPDLASLETGQHHTELMSLYGRTWQVTTRPGPAYAASVRGQGMWFRLFAGLASAAVFLTYLGVRKNADTRLRNAEEHYRTLVEQSPAMVYLDEVGGDWRYVSPKIEAVLGYTPEDLTQHRVKWQDCIDPRDRERVLQTTRSNLGEGQTISLSYRMRTRTGRTIWVQDEAAATRDPASGVWLVRGVLYDITQRMRAENDRQALLEIMQALVSAPNPRAFAELVHASLSNVIYAENFFTLLRDPGTGLFDVIYSVDSAGELPSRRDIGRGLAAYVFRTGSAQIVSAERFDELRARGEVDLVGSRSASWLGAPLKIADRVIGVIAVQDHETPDRYSEHDREFLVSVAAQVAVAIERQQAEETLRRSEASLQLAQAVSHLGNWELDVVTGTGLWSKEMFRLFDRDPADGVPVLDDFLGKVSPDDRSALMDAQMRAIESGERVTLEYRACLTPNDVRHFEATLFSVKDEQGVLIRMAGTVLDITSRKKAELEREALLEILRGMAVAPDTPVFMKVVHAALSRVIYAKNLCVVIHNPSTGRFEEIYSADQRHLAPIEPGLLMRGPAGHVFRADRAVILTPGLFEELRARGEVESSGDAPASWMGAPLKSGASTIGVIVVQDYETPDRYSERDSVFLASVAAQVALSIERQHAHEALLENDTRLAEAHRIAHLGVWDLDLTTNQLEWSDEIYRIFGIEPEEFEATYEAFLGVIHPDDREMVNQAYKDSLVTRAPYDIEHRLLLKDGQVKYVHERCRTWFDESGKPLRSVGTVQDITEARTASAKIIRLSHVVEQTGDAVVITDVEGNPEYVNPAFERQTGYTLEDVVGKTPRILESGTESPELYERMWAAILRGETFEAELHTRRKDGELICVAQTISPIRDEHGAITRFVATGKDITNRKRAESRLREATELYQTVFDVSLDGLVVFDGRFRIKLINRRAAEMYGFARSEAALGVSGLDLVVPEQRERVRQEAVQQLESGLAHGEMLAVRRDGSTFPAEYALIQLTAGENKGERLSIGVTRDITRQWRDKALKSTQFAVTRLMIEARSLTEAAPELLSAMCDATGWEAGDLWQLDQPGDPLRWIAGWYAPGSGLDEFAAFNREHPFAPGPFLVKRLYAENQPIWVEDINAFGQPRSPVGIRLGVQSSVVIPVRVEESITGIIVLYQRGVRPLEADLLQVFDSIGRQIGLVAARQHAEQALAVERNSLAHRVSERTSEISRVNAELAQAVRTKDEFLANMSHELRTPLNAILALSESLLEQLRGPLNERQQASVNTIESSGRHLLSLISDILDLSKVEAGRMELQLQPVALSDICEASLAFVRETAAKKQLLLAFQMNDQLARVEADSIRLKQMLVNLLSNAVKFTPAGGRVSLEVDTDAELGVVRFAVRDSGIGISPDDLSRLFQPFTQVDASLSRQYEGTGLGLALVRRLAELHGGMVAVESEVGEGSCFTIALPYTTAAPENSGTSDAAEQAAREAPITGPPREPGAARARILLAEDTEANIMAIGDYLIDVGYDLVVARNGREAIELARETRPELILMDIQMPVMDGLEATGRLRAMPEFATVPIIALTGLAMPGDRERCVGAGATEYLTKPVSPKAMVKMIQNLLMK